MVSKGLQHLKKTDFIWIFFGTALMAVGTNFFYAPEEMTPGGFTGVAILLREFTRKIIPGGLPLWAGNILLNIPLILLSIRIRGWKFIRRTFFAALLFSLHLLWIPEIDVVKGDMFLTAVFGGVIMGLGLGMVLYGKATTGGTDTLAALIQYYMPYMTVARILPFLDGTVIAASAFVFGLKITLYAIISVALASHIADSLTTGFKYAKVAYIISDEYKAIADAVMNEMDRGVTVLNAKGMYTQEKRPVLMCAVSPKEVVTLRAIAADYDKNAFMVIMNASEIRGEGFLPYSAHEEL